MRINCHRAGIAALAVILLMDVLPNASAQKTGPNSDTIEILRDVEFGKGGERALKMHILRPKVRPTAPMPALVFVHGGGWRSGDKETGVGKLRPFAEKGYLCASIEYRLLGEAVFPANIEDCKCAIRFLRAKAKEYNLDPNRIGAWGSSSGGHLVALLGTSDHVKELEGTGGWLEFSSRVNAVCDFSGPADFPKWWKETEHPAITTLLGGPWKETMAQGVLASPVTHASNTSPPFLIVHGDADKTVPLSQSESLHEALKMAGADVKFHVVKDGGHGLKGPEIDRMVEEFFDGKLKGGG